MKCDEVLQLAEEYVQQWGRSTYYEETESHLSHCMACRQAMIAARWRLFWRRPGPFALIRALSWTRRMRGNAARGDELPSPTTRIAHTIVFQAMRDGADAVRIAPEKRGVRVLYRRDGEWREKMQLPRYIQLPLTLRYKAMADLLLLEERKPQEGYFRLNYEGRSYDVELSVEPAAFGERITLRCLEPAAV